MQGKGKSPPAFTFAQAIQATCIVNEVDPASSLLSYQFGVIVMINSYICTCNSNYPFQYNMESLESWVQKLIHIEVSSTTETQSLHERYYHHSTRQKTGEMIFSCVLPLVSHDGSLQLYFRDVTYQQICKDRHLPLTSHTQKKMRKLDGVITLNKQCNRGAPKS